VQGRVRSDLNGQWEQIEKKSAEIKAKADANRQDWTFAEFTKRLHRHRQHLSGRPQVASQRAQHPAVFRRGIRMGADARLRSRGVELAGGIDLSKIEGLARENAGKNGVEIPKMDLPQVPKKNVALVQPHVAKLKEWLPMAVLGL
jgi:hypothetical protein